MSSETINKLSQDNLVNLTESLINSLVREILLVMIYLRVF